MVVKIVDMFDFRLISLDCTIYHQPAGIIASDWFWFDSTNQNMSLVKMSYLGNYLGRLMIS